MNFENTLLDKKEIESFLQSINVHQNTDQLIQLEHIIKGVIYNIPFNNLFLLNSQSIRPTSQDVINLMLTGQGGLCDVMNPFLYLVFKSLGYEIAFMSASMEFPHCHIILKVSIKGRKYLIDAGNGYPYLNPLPLDEERFFSPRQFSHRLFNYKVESQQGKYYMFHKTRGSKQWKADYNFYDKSVLFSSFDDMLKKQYTKIGWGPFLKSIQIKKWTNSGGLFLRNNFFWDADKNIKKRISNPAELHHCLQNNFHIEMEPLNVNKIWNIWQSNIMNVHE